ncbi:MAG: Gfo/Idh/MocA family protein [Limisphaerales bacterium]
MSTINRRNFIKQSAITTAGVWIARSSWAKISPNEKLNIGVIGTANRAMENMNEMGRESTHQGASENIVALCDVDKNFLGVAKAKFPEAKTYTDFRRLLDQKNIDAILVATPDHTHAIATMSALKSGRHVYCEKPLTHTVSEARAIREAAKKYKLVTQMGTQIHSLDNYRRVVEVLQSGAIGPVREVHVTIDVVYTAGPRPPAATVPADLDWDLWLGPVEARPYSPEYVPRSWRNWWAFGGGTLSDFGCHYIDLAFWALGIRVPTSVTTEGPPVMEEGTPEWLIAHYDFPARGTQPPVKLSWYHGKKNGVNVRPPQYSEPGAPQGLGNGLLFIGDKGRMFADYGRYFLYPEADFKGFVPPPKTIPSSPGQHAEWIRAIKYGGTPLCNFEYGGALTEAVLLGNAAYRSGQKIVWDAKNMKAVGNPAADNFIQHHYRQGWSL